MSTTEEQVKNIVAEQLGVKEDEVKNESSFVDDLGADSLDTVELVMALEEEFEIEIPDEAAQALAAAVPFPKRLGKADEFALLAEQIITNPMLNGEVIRLDGGIRMQ